MLFDAEAEKYNVYPLDSSFGERAMTGILHSGTLVVDPRSNDRASL